MASYISNEFSRQLQVHKLNFYLDPNLKKAACVPSAVQKGRARECPVVPIASLLVQGVASVEGMKSYSSARVEGTALQTMEEIRGFIPLPEITVDCEMMSDFGKSSTHVGAYNTACPLNSSLSREFMCNVIIITEVPSEA